MGVFLIIKNEFLKGLRYKKKLILSLLIPIVAILFAMGINSIMKPSINIGAIDYGSDNSYEVFKEKSLSIRGLNVKKANAYSINTDMILGKYSAIVKLNKGESFEVKSLDSKYQDTIKQVMGSYFKSGELKGFKNLLHKMKKDSITVPQRGGGFILLILIITCTLASCSLIKDQEDGGLKRFSISPHKPVVYIMGIFLYSLLFTAVQILISAIILTILPLSLGIDMLQFLAIGLTIAFIASCFSCFIVALSKTELQASLIASMLSLIMSLLGGSFLPLNKMPMLLEYASNITITKWLLSFIEKIQQGVINFEAFTPIGIILGMSIMMVILSCKLGEKKFRG